MKTLPGRQPTPFLSNPPDLTQVCPSEGRGSPFGGSSPSPHLWACISRCEGANHKATDPASSSLRLLPCMSTALSRKPESSGCHSHPRAIRPAALIGCLPSSAHSPCMHPCSFRSGCNRCLVCLAANEGPWATGLGVEVLWTMMNIQVAGGRWLGAGR